MPFEISGSSALSHYKLRRPFDETRPIMLDRANGLGLGLEQHVKSGVITVQQVDPAEISPGEFAARIRDEVKGSCKLVVIDTLNGYLNAMPGEKYLNNQLHELVSYLNYKGVLTILILAQHGLVAAAEAPVDLSYLSDTVVSLRFFEAAGEVKQSIAMIKKRSGPHEKTIREFKLAGWQRRARRSAVEGISRRLGGSACVSWPRSGNDVGF